MGEVPSNGRSLFVVHGRNEDLRRSMFEFLRSISLAPMEWTTAVQHTGEGSPYIGQVLDAAFSHATAVVVLMTPDETGRRIPPRSERRPLDFSLTYLNKGGNRIDKLQVINRGTETAYEVDLEIPTDAALQLQETRPSKKIPGGGSP